MTGETSKLLLGVPLTACCVTTLFSWWVYIPYYRRLLHRLDPAEHQRTGGWTFFSSSGALDVCIYFLKREYLRSDDKRIRRHGRILRWTFSIPLVLLVVGLVAAMIFEGLARAR